jgi:hypothetical protein
MTKTEVRKLSWGGSLRYQTTTCTIPKRFLDLWLKEGKLPTHVQLTQDDSGQVTIIPVAWPSEGGDPMELLQSFKDEGLDLTAAELDD